MNKIQAYVCSRFADPSPEVRRLNVAISVAIWRWAKREGMDAHSPLRGARWQDEETPQRRAEALGVCVARCTSLGAASGVLLVPAWQAQAPSAGMRAEIQAFTLANRALVASLQAQESTAELTRRPGKFTAAATGGIRLVQLREIWHHVPGWVRRELVQFLGPGHRIINQRNNEKE